MAWRDIPRFSADDFRPTRCGGTPVVIVDQNAGWQAIERWSPDYLRSTIGSSEVALREVCGPPSNVYQHLAEGGRIGFDQFLDWILQTGNSPELRAIQAHSADPVRLARSVKRLNLLRSYSLDIPLARLAPRLLDDVQVPGWFEQPPVDVFFWLGLLGTSCGLHFDLTPNCNVQVAGRKHFALCPAREAGRLQHLKRGAHCRFDPFDPDFDRFPRAEGVPFWRCTLAPGESLYIPAGWFHQVIVASPWSVNVNFFWQRPFPQGLLTPVMWRLILRRGWIAWRAGRSAGAEQQIGAALNPRSSTEP